MEIGVERVEDAQDGPERGVDVAGLDAREVSGRESRETGRGPLRLTAMRADRREARADFKLWRIPCHRLPTRCLLGSGFHRRMLAIEF